MTGVHQLRVMSDIAQRETSDEGLSAPEPALSEVEGDLHFARNAFASVLSV